MGDRPPDEQTPIERADWVARWNAPDVEQLANMILIEILRFARAPRSTRIRVKGTAGRDAILSCGHRFRQGLAHPMPAIGALACCPICGKT